MRNGLLIGTVAITLAACAPQVPGAGQGVGFGNPNQYEADRARREAALTGGSNGAAAGFGAPISTTAPLSGGSVISQNELAAVGIGSSGAAPFPAGVSDPNRTLGVQASPSNADPFTRPAGLSDEQDFDAVAERESIESDAERLARQSAAYQVIQPTALPDRSGSTGPNIVEYALNAPNQKGQAFYSRFVLSGEARFRRNCATYRSADEAQRDFLARGGPERDPRGLDPDGDGFACGWDPAPFRAGIVTN